VLGLLNAFALAGMLVLMNLSPEQDALVFSYHRSPLPAVILAVVLLITSALAVVILGLALWLWRGRSWARWGRALYTAYALLAVAYIPLLASWNLLGFQW
jgi:hypothetical protein